MKKLVWLTVVLVTIVLLSTIAQGSESESFTPPLITTAQVVDVPPEHLTQSKILGIGTIVADQENNTTKFTKGKDSKGMVLMSPAVFGKYVVVKFSIKPLRHEGECEVFLSISSIGTNLGITPPEGYDGNLDFWTKGNIQSYMFAFHTGYHQPNAFIKKNPGQVDIVQAKDVVTEEKWYKVECGRDGKKLWMKIDGKTICEAIDSKGEELPGGYAGISLRGPDDGSFSCLVKDFTFIAGELLQLIRRSEI